MIKAVISDFGGVVTLPLIEGFKRAHEEIGVPVEALGKAMALTASRAAEPPLWTLERGQITEHEFLTGLEFWVDKDDDYPTRGLGEVVTGSTVELGALRLDVAFFVWHIEGRTAVGRYDVIRRA